MNTEAYRDYPLAMIAESMQAQIDRGARCYQKYTCAGCGERVMVGTPNVVFASVKHEDCGTVSKLTGCNFLFILPLGRS